MVTEVRNLAVRDRSWVQLLWWKKPKLPSIKLLFKQVISGWAGWGWGRSEELEKYLGNTWMLGEYVLTCYEPSAKKTSNKWLSWVRLRRIWRAGGIALVDSCYDSNQVLEHRKYTWNQLYCPLVHSFLNNISDSENYLSPQLSIILICTYWEFNFMLISLANDWY